jgi:hypothetical protein
LCGVPIHNRRTTTSRQQKNNNAPISGPSVREHPVSLPVATARTVSEQRGGDRPTAAPSTARGFNTDGLDWTPRSITILANGQDCLIDRPIEAPAPFDKPFFNSLTLAFGIGANAPTPSTPLPATTEIDWVRVRDSAG